MKLKELKKLLESSIDNEQAQLELVKQNPHNIRDIKNPTEAVQLAAVRQDDYALNIILNGLYKRIPSEAVQLAAVKKRGRAIGYITQAGIVPSEAVQIAAVSQDGAAIISIDNPSNPVIKTALTNQSFVEKEVWYNSTIEKLFANNTLLMKKWLRYGENMRNDT